MESFCTPGRAVIVAVALALLIPLGVWSCHDVRGDDLRAAGPLDRFNLDGLQIDRSEILRGIVDKHVTALSNPEALRIENVGFLLPSDMVLGISLNGQARAYPIGMLTRRQVVNDRLGGLPIAVFYCPLSDAATVVERRIDDELLEFDVSGFIYESNVLLYDYQQRGLWSQLGFTAISGPHAGRSLWHINNWELTTYESWTARYPDSTVVSIEGSGGRSAYASYMLNDRILFPVSQHDDRLADKTPVVGIRNRGVARAYPVEQLLAAGLILDELAGDPVVLRASPDGSISIDEAPRDAFVAHAFWFAWYAQHPDTDVY